MVFLIIIKDLMNPHDTDLISQIVGHINRTVVQMNQIVDLVNLREDDRKII